MIENVFSFGDFLNKTGNKKPSGSSLREKFEEEDRLESEKVINKSLPIVADEEDFGNYDKDEVFIENPILGGPKSSHTIHDRTYQSDMRSRVEEEEEEEKEVENYESTNESRFVNEDDGYYKIYSDKSEDFICDISIEGANPEETEARIVIESEDWTLQFTGELRNGKCFVPIKKLNILKEGQVGKIKLEVIAEGNLFIPWEDNFKVKLSKKVTVKVNEQKSNTMNRQTGVKVSIKK
jgi:hypothetical protein